MKKIDKLKKELLIIQKEYHMKIYKIFSEIYNIRKKENLKYNYVNLSNESIICEMYDYAYVVNIMQIEKFTKTTWKAINKGYFTIFSMASNLRRSKKLQTGKYQNDFVRKSIKKIDKGNFTKRSLRQEITRLNNEDKTESNPETFWLLQAVYEIKAVKKYIIDRFDKLDIKNKNKIIKEVLQLYNFVTDKINKEYKFISVKQDTLHKLRNIKLRGINGRDLEGKLERLIEHYITKDLIKCKFCNKTFTQKRNNQIFCCIKCKRDYNNRKNGKK